MNIDLHSAIIDAMLRIKDLQKQIENAESNNRHRLQLQLKELQILQIWQLSQAENNKESEQVSASIEKFEAIFTAARAESEEVLRIALAKADLVKAFLDNGDLNGLRKFFEEEKTRLEK